MIPPVEPRATWRPRIEDTLMRQRLEPKANAKRDGIAKKPSAKDILTPRDLMLLLFACF
jgi:hypothetical protein